MSWRDWFGSRDNRWVQQDRVWDAKRVIADKEPFFGYMLEAMRVRMEAPKAFADRGSNWAAAADGRSVFINPEWAKDLPDWELQSVILHQMLHNALLHPLRMGDRDYEMWNVACDFIVNYRMKKHGFRLGRDWLDPAMLPALGLPEIGDQELAEEVYDRLQQASKDQKQKMLEAAGLGGKGEGSGEGSGSGKGEGGGAGQRQNGGMGGDVMKQPDLEYGEDKSDVEMDAKGNLAKAVAKSKGIGNLPGDWEQLYKRLTTSVMDWRDRVKQYLGGGRMKQPTWSRPNRRYAHDGTYMPGNGAYGPGEVVILIDTSGSIDDGLLQRFIDEVDKCHADFGSEALHVVCVDTKVQWAESFGPYDEVTVNAKGRGGTALAAGFRWINDHGIDPKAVIFFSDLMNHNWGPKPHYPVLWVVWPGGWNKVPFGEIIHMQA